MDFAPLPYVAIPLLLIGIINILIGLFVVVKRWNHTNVNFVLFCFSVSFWGIFLSLMSSGISIRLMPFGFKGAAWAGSFIPLFLLFISMTFPDRKLRLSKYQLILLSFPCIFFASISFSDLWLKPQIMGDRVALELLPFFTNTYLLYFLGYFFWAGKNFYQILKNSSSIRRLQCQYFFLGLLLTSAIGIFCNIILVYFKIGSLVYFGPLGTIFIVGFTAYAITKHRLMDIEIAIKRTAVYSILTAALTGIFLSFILLGEFIFRGLVGYSSVWITILAAFVVALAFQPLRDRIQKVVDRLFFKGKYDYRDILKALSQTSISIINLDQLLNTISANISKALKPSKITIYLWDKDKNLFRPRGT